MFMLSFVLQLVWIGFMYYIVSENNKKSEYQGNPILYAILTFFVGFVGSLGYYFGNKFKEITGKSFVDYLNDMRLLNAFNKIATSDMPLEDISGEVGYENFSYFYRRFKQKYGFTPGALRKNKNKTKK